MSLIPTARILLRIQDSCIIGRHSHFGLPPGSAVRIHLQRTRLRKHGFDPWVGKIHWRRKWQPTPLFLPGKSQGQRNLVCHSPWGHKELDMWELDTHVRTHARTHTCGHTHTHTLSLCLFSTTCLSLVGSLPNFPIPLIIFTCDNKY